jgi:hypothetical protein
LSLYGDNAKLNPAGTISYDPLFVPECVVTKFAVIFPDATPTPGQERQKFICCTNVSSVLFKLRDI